MAKGGRKTKAKKKAAAPKVVKPYDPAAYRINSQGLRGRLQGKRVLEDTTADPDQFKNVREKVFPGPTIPRPFRAYRWEGS